MRSKLLFIIENSSWGDTRLIIEGRCITILCHDYSKPLQFVTFTSVRENQMEVSYMMLDNGNLVHSSILNIGR
jgi:hypothetical protein